MNRLDSYKLIKNSELQSLTGGGAWKKIGIWGAVYDEALDAWKSIKSDIKKYGA